MEELSEVYQPKTVLFRDEEITDLKEKTKLYKEKKVIFNLIILGPSGSGKTTLIKKTLGDNIEGDFIYLSCANLQSSKKIFRRLYNTDFSITIEKFKQNPKIIIFDEINKVKDLTEFFDDINTFYREVQAPIILITNRQDISRKMPEDCKNTLFFERIFFKSYNPIQIGEILKKRLEEAEQNGKTIPVELTDKDEDEKKHLDREGIISFISQLAYHEGSIRLAFRLLNNCIESNKFSKDFIELSFAKVQREEVNSWIETLNETEKTVLRGLVEIPLSHEIGGKIPYRIAYSELAEYLFKNTDIKTSSRLSQILWRFEFDDIIIKTKSEFLGRAGGKKKIISIISEETFKNLVEIIFPEGLPYKEFGEKDG